MSFTLYDKALHEKIKNWALDPEATVLAPDETRQMLSIKADKQHDRPIKLPLITLNRNRESTVRITGNRRMSNRGLVFNSDYKISDHLNAIPVSLGYTINIYCRTMEEADEYVRNFLFNLINYPKVGISIPYNDSNLFYTSYLTLLESVEDNSDIPERLVPGQFSRFTISIALNDAYLFSYNRRKVPKIVTAEIRTQLPVEENPNISIDGDEEETENIPNVTSDVIIFVDSGKEPHRISVN